MAKILLLQVSDIHLKGEEDPILQRAGAIVDAVKNLDYRLDAAIIVMSGDLAYSGEETQYWSGWSFLEEIRSKLSESLQKNPGSNPIPVQIVAIPGNHDCDFSS
jgi:metallophosphoesterase superfamily enzyme